MDSLGTVNFVRFSPQSVELHKMCEYSSLFARKTIVQLLKITWNCFTQVF